MKKIEKPKALYNKRRENLAVCKIYCNQKYIVVDQYSIAFTARDAVLLLKWLPKAILWAKQK